MPFLETVLGQLALGTGTTAVWETGKLFLNRTSQRSVEDLFVRAFGQACNDLQNGPEYATRRKELKFDDIRFRQLLRDEAVRPSPSAAATVQDANYNAITELLADAAVIQIGDESLSDDDYKQLIRNVVRYAQARFREALLEDEQGFRHLVSETLARNNEQLTEMAGLLERLDLPDLASSIRSIEAQTAQLSSDTGYIMSMTEDIHRAVVREPASPTKPARLLFNVPRQNTYFTGRAELLQNLTEALDAEKPTAIVQAVQGLGGVGKTQLAIEYVYENADKYSVVGWIRAEDPSTTQADLSELSVTLGQAAESDSQSTKRSALNTWLASNQGWILVFDNAVGPDEVAPYIPSSPSGKVLITSRARNWKNLATTLKVSTWERSESIEFIHKRLSDITDDEAGLIADLLDNLPLALEQTVAYMEQTGCGPVEYARLFEEEREELWGAEERPLDYKDTVATTWNVSINRIRQESEDAADLMNLLAYLAPEDILLGLLEAGAADLPRQLPSAFSSTVKAQSIVRTLTRYSLVEERSGLLNVHRLVQVVIQDSLEKDEKEFWLSSAIKLMLGSFIFSHRNVETWWQTSILLPHTVSVVLHAITLNVNPYGTSELLHRLGKWHIHNLEHPEAIASLTDAKDIRESCVNPLDLSLAPLLTDLGLAMLAGPHDVLTDPSLIVSRESTTFTAVAWIAVTKGYFERAIEIEKFHHTVSHPLRVASRLEPFARFLRVVGNATRNNDLFQQAERVTTEAYEIAKREEAKGKATKTEVAHFVNTRANLYRNLGKSAKAIERFEYALELITLDTQADPEHPFVVGIQRNLTMALIQAGQFEQAEDRCRRALEIAEKQYYETHTHRLELVFALAYILKRQASDDDDKSSEAEALMSNFPSELINYFERRLEEEVVPYPLYDPRREILDKFLDSVVFKERQNTKRESPEPFTNQIRHKGNVYDFSFPVKSIPPKGSDSCPCGSGIRFFNCHKKDFQRALKAHLTQRG